MFWPYSRGFFLFLILKIYYLEYVYDNFDYNLPRPPMVPTPLLSSTRPDSMSSTL